MKYKFEMDLPENKLALALELLKSLSFVRNVKQISSSEMSTINGDEHPLEPKRPFGVMKGSFVIPDDFDEPLDDLKEYMA
jgi:Protein of unknown function (DUF2281)